MLIDADKSDSYFAGGYAHDNGTFAHAAVENDSISITNGTITLVEGWQPPYVFDGPEVVGGTGTGLAQNNNVTVSGNGKIYGGNVSTAGIYGGRSRWDRAVNNRVSITDHGALVQIDKVMGGAQELRVRRIAMFRIIMYHLIAMGRARSDTYMAGRLWR